MPLFPSVVAEGVPVVDIVDAPSVNAVNVIATPTVSTATPTEKPATMPSGEAATALKKHDWMFLSGLSATVANSVNNHPLRIVIADNSGSMNACDGKRLVHHQGAFKTVGCSRWKELSEDVSSIAKMSEALGCRTDVHMLNPTPTVGACSVCTAAWSGGIKALGRSVDAGSLQRTLESVNPSGTTPLTEAVMKVASMIQPMAPRLRAEGQAVAVLICTDGLPNNKGSFVQAMRHLQTLPVWCVVRLVTDDDDVVSYWNDLDAALEAPLEVLDDVRGEAAEVHQLNPWLTYAPPLHLARLFGLPEKLFDALDEAPLLPSQIKAFLQMLLGCDTLPEPELDVPAFLEDVRLALKDAPPAYDPRSGKMKPWVDLRALERSLYRSKRCGKEGGCVLM